MLEELLPNVYWEDIIEATKETLYMTSISVLATFFIGILLGLVLFLTGKGNLWENRVINTTMSAIVNIFRSIPFLILIVLLIPFTKLLVGSMIGEDLCFTSPYYRGGTILCTYG